MVWDCRGSDKYINIEYIPPKYIENQATTLFNTFTIADNQNNASVLYQIEKLKFASAKFQNNWKRKLKFRDTWALCCFSKTEWYWPKTNDKDQLIEMDIVQRCVGFKPENKSKMVQWIKFLYALHTICARIEPSRNATDFLTKLSNLSFMRSFLCKECQSYNKNRSRTTKSNRCFE